jgi:hypothetical protein
MSRGSSVGQGPREPEDASGTGVEASRGRWLRSQLPLMGLEAVDARIKRPETSVTSTTYSQACQFAEDWWTIVLITTSERAGPDSTVSGEASPGMRRKRRYERACTPDTIHLTFTPSELGVVSKATIRPGEGTFPSSEASDECECPWSPGCPKSLAALHFRQPLPAQELPTQPLPPQPLPRQPLPPQPLAPQALPAQPLPPQPLTMQALPAQALALQPLPPQPLAPHMLPRQPLAIQRLAAQPLKLPLGKKNTNCPSSRELDRAAESRRNRSSSRRNNGDSPVPAAEVPNSFWLVISSADHAIAASSNVRPIRP